ncbi:MAG: SDR family oxidoreductase [bacterium]
MKVLYIGGTGQISFDCVHESVQQGQEIYVFNRGNSNDGLPVEVRHIPGDVNDPSAYNALAAHNFDVVCQFRVYTPVELRRDLRVFTGSTGQYLFISSTSAYKKPLPCAVITEDVPLGNPYAEYSRNKAACEVELTGQSKLPYTIVRPSHTSRNRFLTSLSETDHAPLRMLAGKPVVVPGDGTSLWTITHSRDFAPPFVRLLGNPRALNETFHLTSDNAYSWNQIYEAMGDTLGVKAKLAHIPSETIVKYMPDRIAGLIGDKMWTKVFDNSKIKAVVGDFSCPTTLIPFMQILVQAFRARGGDKKKPDPAQDTLFDRMIAEQQALGQT